MNIVNEINNNDFKVIKINRQPTLIKNGLKYFPKLKKWNIDYIIENYGEKSCSYSYHARPVRSKLECNYKTYFENYNKTYTFTRKIFDINEKNTFIDDFTFPNPFLCIKDLDKQIFYCGPAYSGALPHSHGPALNLMVYGRKRWIFFDTLNEIGKKLENKYYQKYPKDVTWMDWFKIEYKNLKQQTNIIECIQEPNDIVYVPDNYNHTVFNMKDTMGIVVELK